MSKEQQRPAQYEFEAAALRFSANDYPSSWEASLPVNIMARVACMFTFQRPPELQPNLRRTDRKIIAAEQVHEGRIVGEENLRVFADKQLARYKELERH